MAVEAEADRHRRDEQKSVGELRQALDWDRLIVPDVVVPAGDWASTSAKDRHVMAAAKASDAGVIVTRNVIDFGIADLNGAGLVAAHPDLFLAATMSEVMYIETLEAMAAVRRRAPKTPPTLHAAFASEHPRLFKRMRALFPNVEPEVTQSPPAEVFRGQRCLICGQGRATEAVTDGICNECVAARAPK